MEIRLLHAKEPGPAFRRDFDRYPNLLGGMERILCPRVRLKSVVIDGVRLSRYSPDTLLGTASGTRSCGGKRFWQAHLRCYALRDPQQPEETRMLDHFCATTIKSFAVCPAKVIAGIMRVSRAFSPSLGQNGFTAKSTRQKKVLKRTFSNRLKCSIFRSVLI